MPPRCRRCKEPDALDKPLFKCLRCSRYYHSACHRPHPQESISNWVCKRCLAGQKGQGKRHYYHDKALLSSRAVSPSSASSRLDRDEPRRFIRMAPTAIPGLAANSDNSFSSQRRDSLTSPIIKFINCSFPGCSAKIDGKREVLCEAHLQVISKPDKKSAGPLHANVTPTPPAPKGTFAVPRLFTSTSNTRKLLPATDKGGPITMRKTAVNPPFIPQQPTPKHSTPPSRGDTTISPRSPQPLAPRLSVNSPPPSPGFFQNGEPARKRQRVSPAPGHSPKAQVNGTLSSQRPTAEPVPGKESLEPGSPQASRRASNASSQRPGKAREKEAKSASRPSARPFIRRVPVGFTSLRFLETPEDSTPGVLSEQSSSGINGSNGAVPRRNSEAEGLSVNGGMKFDFTGKISSPTSSAARTESIDSSSQSRRASEVINGESPKAPPERRTSDTKSGYGPFQANGIAFSKPPPKKIHFPIQPAKITTTQPLHLPKPKEIDISHFDSIIYSQPGASTPPPDIDHLPATNPSPPPPKPSIPLSAPPKDEPLYLPIDPRIHWPQPHSQTWLAAKQYEIHARGKKKANFGRAAQSLQRQQQQQVEKQPSFEESLPEKIAENAAWVRALRRLRGMPPSSLVGRGGSEQGDGTVTEVSSSGGSVNGGGSGNGGESGVLGPQRRGKKSQQQQQQQPQGITGKRIGNSGLVVVTGLNGAQMGGLRRDG